MALINSGGLRVIAPQMSDLPDGSHAMEHRHSSFSAKICRICSDEVKDSDNGQTFVACHLCAFPVCKPCYEYERSNGNKCCPQCNTPYKRHEGSPRIAGDENKGPVDSDDELDIKNSKDASSIQHNFAYGSENGDYNSKRPKGRAFSSTGSVLGKEFEAERDGATDAEWKDRVDKWKARQEKRGLVAKGEQTNNQCC